MKRFTDTEKWRDPWFRSLPAPSKLAFFYILDHCNNAGFHELDSGLMVILTGMKAEQVEGALKGLQRSIVGPCGGWYWVRRFLRHQKNEDLNAANPAHKQIISLTRDQLARFKDSPEFQEFVGPLMGLLSPIGIGKGIGKEEGSGEKQTKAKGTENETAVFFAELGLPKSDGVWFFNKCIANGWKNAGKPILDWKATVRSWRAANYLPSQKTTGRPMATAGGRSC